MYAHDRAPIPYTGHDPSRRSTRSISSKTGETRQVRERALDSPIEGSSHRLTCSKQVSSEVSPWFSRRPEDPSVRCYSCCSRRCWGCWCPRLCERGCRRKNGFTSNPSCGGTAIEPKIDLLPRRAKIHFFPSVYPHLSTFTLPPTMYHCVALAFRDVENSLGDLRKGSGCSSAVIRSATFVSQRQRVEYGGIQVAPKQHTYGKTHRQAQNTRWFYRMDCVF